MNLQQLQYDLYTLIKSPVIATEIKDDYLDKVSRSENLLLIRKISLWWRKNQIENYCVLTPALLKSKGEFDLCVKLFLEQKPFSYFREELSIQFLQYLVAGSGTPLVKSVAAFELAIMKLRRGEPIHITIDWGYEPYSIINALLKNTFSDAISERGEYEVVVSYQHKEELFIVHDKMPGLVK